MDNYSISLFHPIHRNIEDAYIFCVSNGIIKTDTKCKLCKSPMTSEKNTHYIGNYGLKCTNENCSKTMGIFEQTNLHFSELTVPEVLRYIFEWTVSFPREDLDIFGKHNLPGWIEFGEKLSCLIKKENAIRAKTKLGGRNSSIQVDIAAIIDKKLVCNLKSSYDTMHGVVWIIGALDENTSDMRLEIIKNRQANTIKDFVRRNIKDYSIIKTDKNPNFPSAMTGLKVEHVVLSSRMNFRNKEKKTVNIMDFLWATLRYQLTIPETYNLQNFNVSDFLEKYLWKKLNMANDTRYAFIDCYVSLVRIFGEKSH